MGNSESSTSYPTLTRNYSTLNFLPKPITEIHAHQGSSDFVNYGMACMQGWRAHMEDEHIMNTDLPNLPGWSFFAVLDGHAGKLCAEVSYKTLVSSVLFEVLPVRDSITGIMDGLKRSFIRHDRSLSANFEVLRSRSGTTCTSILLTNTHAVFSNLGDSRAVLAHAGKPTFATCDHKPSGAIESKRIRAAGGSIIMDRVDGGLAVSRAFGDFDYKMRSDLPSVAQKVSPEPDTFAVSLLHDGDEFLLLACDGVWDVINTTAAVKYVHTVLNKHGHTTAGARAAAEALVQRCLSLGSRDNISVVIVCILPRAPVVVPPESPEEQIARLAASVACNAVVSAIEFVVTNRGSSVLPPLAVRETQVSHALGAGLVPASPQPSAPATPQTHVLTTSADTSVVSPGGSQHMVLTQSKMTAISEDGEGDVGRQQSETDADANDGSSSTSQ